MKRTLIVIAAGAMLLSFLALEALYGMGSKVSDPAATIPYLHVSGNNITKPFLWSPDKPMERGFLQFGYEKEEANLSSIRYPTEEFLKGYIAGTMDMWTILASMGYSNSGDLFQKLQAWQSCQLKNGVRRKATTGAATVDEAYMSTTKFLKVAAKKIAKDVSLGSVQIIPEQHILLMAWFGTGAPDYLAPISSCIATEMKAIKKKEEAEKKKG